MKEELEMLKIILTATGFFVTIGLAVWKHLKDLKSRDRDERLGRINDQLKNLYGPVFVQLNLRQTIWQMFESKVAMDDWDRRCHTASEEDKNIWKVWSKEEFAPSNQRIHDLIINHSDLIIESDVPRPFVSFVTHYTQFKVIVDMWENGGIDLFPEQAYPNLELMDYFKRSFENLKAKQYDLLGHKHELIIPEKPRNSQIKINEFENWGGE